MKHKESTTIQTVEESTSCSHITPGEIIIGTLVAIDGEGRPLVNFSGNAVEHALIAITTLGLTKTHIGRQVALLFANGDLQSPVIMGLIHSPLEEMLENFAQSHTQSRDGVAIETDLNVEDVQVDGKRIIFEAKEEIVFKCGESSITLTKSGKVLIRGKYLLNRSTGVNRIMGGSVQVN